MSDSSSESEGDSDNAVMQHSLKSFMDLAAGLTEMRLRQSLAMRLLELSLRSQLNELLSSTLIVPGVSNVAQMFLPCESESESAMLEKRLETWRGVQHPEGQGHFSQKLTSEIRQFLVEPFNRMVKTTQNIPAASSTPFADEDNFMKELFSNLCKHHSVQLLVKEINDFFLTVMNEAHNNCSLAGTSLSNCEDTAYVTDLSAVSKKNLFILSQVFSKCPPLQSEEFLPTVLKYVPKKPKRAQPLSNQQSSASSMLSVCAECLTQSTTSNVCSGCCKSFCDLCPLKKGKVPSGAHFKIAALCTKCYDKMLKDESVGWSEKRTQLLQSENEDDVQAALACFLMELFASKYVSSVAINLANKFAKQLIEEDLPHLALPLLSAISSKSEVQTEKIRAHILASKALESMAYGACTLPKEQISLLRAAKAECDAVSKIKSSDTEVPDLSTRIQSLEKTASIIQSENERQLKRAIQLAYEKLATFWLAKDWDSIFELVSDKANDHLKRADGANPTMKAIKEFVEAKRAGDGNKMMLTFLDAVLCIFEDNICDGIANMRVVVWGMEKHALSHKFYDTVIDLVVGVLLKHPEYVMPLQNLRGSIESLSKGRCFDPDILVSSLHLKEQDLIPPFKPQWPQSHLLQVNMGVKSFEDFAMQKATKGEWTGIKVAECYLDSIEKCRHPSEITLCFINASLWLLKSLNEKSIECPTSPEVYSLKMAVFHYLTQAFIISMSCLHTGMHMYVARIAVAATLLASKYAGQQATSTDAEKIVQFLYTFLQSGRFCPFWNAPLVLASEAAALNERLDKQHCAFISKLKHISQEFCHLERFEVLYKLYENDFVHLEKQNNHAEVKQQTMQELLQRKGLTWDNVSSLMKSSLCKRTPEGWISLELSQLIDTNLEFAEIKGIRVHMNSFSILDPLTLELLVIRSDRRNGLISSSDVDTFLTIEPDELGQLYFSLDPPSRDEKYHPFQELRFHPNSLQKTEVLETLLDADYLMKFFSVGSEVSANPPFDQRPCKDGLLSKLPPHLRQALKSISEYGNAKSSLYRFWIEAKEIEYEVESSGSVVTVKCGSPKMIIKKHRMYFNPDGKMHDTESDDDPDSAESKFAAAMTAHYDEIAEYFPAYARLKEFCKLQLLTTYIKNNVAKFTPSSKVVVTDIETNAKINVNAKKANKPTPPCWWVPASVSETVTMRCYGGVNLAPEYVSSTLPALPLNVSAYQLQGASNTRLYSSAQRPTLSSGVTHTKQSSSSAKQSVRPQPLNIPKPRRQQSAKKPTSHSVSPVLDLSATCKELPIANALLPLSVSNVTYRQQLRIQCHVFEQIPQGAKRIIQTMFPAAISGQSRSSASRSSAGKSIHSARRASSGAGGAGGGGGGDAGGGGAAGASGGGGGGSGNGVPSSVLTGVVGALIVVKSVLLAKSIRDQYAQRKCRKQHNCKDPNIHVAHILSLEVVTYVVEEGIWNGAIKMSRKEIINCLRKAMNIQQNFALVPRKVNLVDHRKYDYALVNEDKEYLHLNKQRGNDISNFLANHLVDNFPLEIAKALLRFFQKCKIVSPVLAQQLESEAEAKAQPNTGVGGGTH